MSDSSGREVTLACRPDGAQATDTFMPLVCCCAVICNAMLCRSVLCVGRVLLLPLPLPAVAASRRRA